MKLSSRVKGISPSATFAIDEKARKLKAQGRDIIAFGTGQPDFPTPDNIKQAAIRAINDNFTYYTDSSGMPELKEAIRNKFRRENKLDYETSQILVTCGGKHALYNIMQALLEKGDEVILPVPYWVSYEEQIRLSQAVPAFAQTDENFRLTADLLKEKITPRTKLIILNSPSNPSGAAIQNTELKKIAEMAVQNNIYVISDDVYEHFLYGSNGFKSIASLNDEIKKLTITMNAVSKTYSMTGWRIGYCAAEKDIISAMSNFQSHTTSNPNSIAQKAAIEALNGPQDSVRKMCSEFEKRRNVMVKMLNAASGISCPIPDGAFFTFPDISGTGLASSKFAEKLLTEAGVAVVPGIAFGSDRNIRLSYATSVENIRQGMERIRELLD